MQAIAHEINYALILGIIWFSLWGVYKKLIKKFQLEDIFSRIFMKFPNYLKCYPFNSVLNKDCLQNDMTFYAIVHIIIYITVGFIVPNYYLTVLIVSIMFEIYEFIIGQPCKIIRDTSMNMFGYFIGSYISNNTKSTELILLRRYIQKYFDKVPVMVSITGAIVILISGFIIKK